jgi:hypothetical protein
MDFNKISIGTTKHKCWVLYYILSACFALLKRGIVHDLSKYSEKFPSSLKHLDYGSSEYKIAMSSLDSTLQHHYAFNSHHPEHYGTIEKMSPLDLIEMLCDWKAAGRRHKNGNMENSLKVNRERFNISNNLYDSLERDSKEIKLI